MTRLHYLILGFLLIFNSPFSRKRRKMISVKSLLPIPQLAPVCSPNFTFLTGPLNSRSKCNTSPEDFRRSFKTQTFSGPVIEPSFDGFEFFERYFSKVSLFGQITANKTNGIFYSAFFPTVERRTEKGFCTKHAIGFQMVGVFGSIVVGQTQTSFLRESA